MKCPCCGSEFEVGILTARETDVVQLLVTGLKNKEIADKLFLSELTVKSHIRKAMAKMECRNRVELTIKMLNHNNGVEVSAGF